MNKVYVDKARLLRRVIIISWITLGLCFLVKIFGGNFFEIMCDNPTYKALCGYADKHFWLKYILSILSSSLSVGLYILAIIQQYKFTKKQIILIAPTILVSCAVKLINNKIGLIFDIWIMFGLPFCLLKFNWKKIPAIIIAFLLNLAFQFVSILAKNLSIGFLDESTFIVLIYGIDVYLMCLLYYLYRNYQKENENMGAFFVLFMGKPVDKLKAMKEKRENQIAKLNEEIKAIEAEIERQKNEK